MKTFIFSILLIYGWQSFSQKIYLEIVDNTTGKRLNQTVTVVFKEQAEKKYKEFTITGNGKVKKQLSYSYDNLEIIIKSKNYYSETILIKNYKEKKDYSKTIYLIKESEEKLSAVVIKSRKKIKVKEDTITYNVASFANGADKKIEDVLKKLPGIEIDPSGIIKVDGKPIETVLLDGDNLFDRNYTIGTKNINVNAISQVQALTHYSNNNLLKGIENSEKTALNLVLKKDMTDLSSDFETGVGLDNDKKFKADANATLLGINKKIKSFGLFAYNNVGISNSPFDYFYYKPSFEETLDKDYFAYEPVNIDKTNFEIKKNFINLNNELFINYNLLKKLNSKNKIKLNGYFLLDKIKTLEKESFDYTLNNTGLNISESNNIKQKTNLNRIDVENIYQPDKNLLITNKLKIQYGYENIKQKLIKNSNLLFNNLLDKTNTYVVNHFNLTKKLTIQKPYIF